MFPKSYQNVAFVVRRGSWNREQKFGYDVAVARISGGKAKIEPFMTGLLDSAKNEFHGRPTYVLPLQDGSLLVSDEQNGAIYRITYQAKSAAR
jgi:glucose/arabinose dehydrogenase